MKQYSKKVIQTTCKRKLHLITWTSLYSQFVLLVCDQNVDGNLQKKITVIRATKNGGGFWFVHRTILTNKQNELFAMMISSIKRFTIWIQ